MHELSFLMKASEQTKESLIFDEKFLPRFLMQLITKPVIYNFTQLMRDIKNMAKYQKKSMNRSVEEIRKMLKT